LRNYSLLLVLVLGLAGCDPSDTAVVGPAKTPEGTSDAQIVRFLQASKRNILRGGVMAAKFAGRLPKYGKTATVEAIRRIGADGAIAYDVTNREGDAAIQKDLIFRFMGGEEETSTRDNSAVAVTPANYKFKRKGQIQSEGRSVNVYEVTPRAKRMGLFKGEIWIDSDTDLPVRESGRFVKSPSVFFKTVDFAREYEIKDGFSVPKKMNTVVLTRLWGQVELDIFYDGFRWQESPRVAQTPIPSNESH
jgi:hypothetical protein